jgi:Cu(I)/Ag(I) efflux system membrane fusion protein
MKTKNILLLIVVAALAAAAGWFAGQRGHHHPSPTGGSAGSNATRKILYYQSAMHPWIKSDQPGRCTICGMELSAVYEGEKGFESGEGIVTLNSNSIQVINVQSDEVRRQPLRRTLRVAGTIDENDAAHRFVSAYIDGRVDHLAVNFVGAEVSAGQPLATFYSPMLLAAEREFVSLQTQKPAGDAALHQEHARLVEAAAQRVKRFGLTDAQIAALPQKDANTIRSEILAPVSGTVVARNVYAGQYVKEGDKLFEIADFSTMWFQFDAYERDFAWLSVGQQVDVTTPAVPGKTFAGRVAFIDPNLKEMTRSAKVRVELSNPLIETNGVKRRELFHKLYADAVVQAETPEVLAVPRGAVLAAGIAPVVYVDKGGGAYEQRRVKLGRCGDDAWEVLDGVNAEERVVLQGNLLIDAQAQLNANVASMAVPVSGSNAPSTTLPPLTDAQRKAAQDFLALVDGLAVALAGDNLSAYNGQAGKTHSATPELLKAFATESPWHALVTPFDSVGHLAAATDLKAARKSFHPLSVAAVALVQALRRQDAQFRSVKVFRCPMTKDAFPGAPRTADWLQLKPEIRNPWFGAEMLDCGSEVKAP